ncbi:MAG: 4Fe-4S binding protein [Desulfobulbaceae bacterium]|jgi:polyferredoxin|nr:4Fe-4S binding protein [Desulfobulbaceae bacterium]MDY0349641.1 4Fe-4S binding protein [Desulfobulbaceae bacterium]
MPGPDNRRNDRTAGAAGKRLRPLAPWRRLSQALFLLIFFFLFIKTDYTGTDRLEYAVNILFRIDPLLAACVMLAVKGLVALMLPALLVVGLTLVLGRFFCGWVCPMGALIDLCHPLLRPRKRRTDTLYPALPYLLLIFVLAGAFFGLPVAGYIDPFSILVRGLAIALYPAFNQAATGFFTFTYLEAPGFVNVVTEPVYSFLRATILPFDQKYYTLVMLSAAVLLAVFVLELVQRRFFCRNLCPLGGLIGLTAAAGFFRGYGGNDDCKACRACRKVCRMGAIDEKRRLAMTRCVLCMDCRDKCPRGLIGFRFSPPSRRPAPVSLSRRAVMAALGGAALLPLFSGVRSMARVPDPFLIRPPGSLPEPEFLGRCVRCGECMKVCIGNALHPSFLESGLEGMFAPRLIPRIGYCEFNCTLCGQVCPTGAIRELALPDKHTCKIGHAFFDTDRCLPYAKGIPCIVCEEHCPTPEKAIRFREAVVENDRGETVTVRQPYVVDALCIGCGICENRCPLPDGAAVYVTAAGEARNPEHALPAADSGLYPPP